MTEWGIWYDDQHCDLGWLSIEGKHGRVRALREPEPAALFETLQRERAHDALATRAGWPSTTFVIGEVGSRPLRCLLHCPKCGVHHIDEGEWATTRVHKSHQCQSCRHEWRPFAYPTVGVAWPPQDEEDDFGQPHRGHDTRHAMEAGECAHDPSSVCAQPKDESK